MALTPGTRLGVYEVTAQIGEGGMGQVYRAADTTLGRQVAIKILPDAFAADPERLARFEREAKTLASLNHPHIAAIYGFEKSAGIHALVMELVEGDDLSQRVARGPMPFSDALSIAKQIAEALEAAHEQGIVHRDLKPANIKVRPDGTVKVLDFGLAKAMAPTGAMSASVSQSPTITTQAMTEAGMILGTAAYMSPEQARGRPVDKRADIWAFGSVLYEMLTGQRTFAGSELSDVLASVLAREPDWTLLPVGMSPVLSTYIRRCLQKDPRQRIHDIADVRLALEGVFETAATPVDGGPVAGAVASPLRRLVLPSVFAGAALTAAALWLGTEAAEPPLVTRLQAARTPAGAVGNSSMPQVAVSPDGRTMAFAGRLADASLGIFVRPLGAEEATLVAGTETSTTAFNPAFSPDGAWIAYRTLQELLKVPVGGGRSTSLARLGALTTQGLSWGADDWIYYAENASQTDGSSLLRVRASGGQPERLTTSAGFIAAWPHAIGEGRYVIYDELPIGSLWDTAHVMLLDTQTGDTRMLLEAAGSGPTVAASEHLLFVRDGSLLAAPFDQNRLEVTGTPREVLTGIRYDTGFGTAQYAVSRNGTLVYLGGATPGTSLMWADTRGALKAFPEDHVYYDPRPSPDGRAVAVEVLEGGDDIWVLDLTRGTQTKLSLSANEDETPAWSPDGLWVAWSTDRDGQRVILRKRGDGTCAEQVLWSGPDHAHVSMYTADW